MEANYDAIRATNWSTLKHLGDSPKHYRYNLDHPADSAAMQRGRAVHCAVYEPDTFERTYVVYPGPVRRGKAWEEFRDEHEHCQILTATEFDVVRRIADAALADPIAGPLLRAPYVEQSITWTDERTGEPCKGRADQIDDRLGDLKTCQSVAPRRWAATVEDLGYLGQMAFYLDGLAANGVSFGAPPVWIAAEANPPHDVVVYEIDERDIAAGRDLYRCYLDRLIECRAADAWPGIADGCMMRFERAAWARPREQAITLGGLEVA
jgi:hypothetical protein